MDNFGELVKPIPLRILKRQPKPFLLGMCWYGIEKQFRISIKLISHRMPQINKKIEKKTFKKSLCFKICLMLFLFESS